MNNDFNILINDEEYCQYMQELQEYDYYIMNELYKYNYEGFSESEY